MGNTGHDPTDHFRTTNPHTGEQFIDPYSWPGVVSIVLGVLSIIASITTAAYMTSDWTLTLGVTGAFAILGGVAWLVLEHRRVLRIESVWKADNSDR
jgi:predicted phage tail protein